MIIKKKNIHLIALALASLTITNNLISQETSEKYLNRLTVQGVSKDIDLKTEKLEKKIDSIYDSAIQFLSLIKKDSSVTYGLLQVFKDEKKPT